jgi:hypothetical protein
VIAAWAMRMYMWRTHHSLPKWDWHTEHERSHENKPNVAGAVAGAPRVGSRSDGLRLAPSA